MEAGGGEFVELALTCPNSAGKGIWRLGLDVLWTNMVRRCLMLDNSLMAFLGFGWLQYTLILCVIVILVAYYFYRKKQM